MASFACYEYAIHVRGHLDAHGSQWLDGATIADEEGGMIRIERPIVDQAAFHGVLNELRTLGLRIIAVQRLGPALCEAPSSEEPR